MTDLENFLRFSPLYEPLQGRSSLQQQTKPTTAGLNWIATPSTDTCVGIAYRYNNNSLEAIRVSESDSVTVKYSVPLAASVVNIASSHDGRLVAICLSDGSLQCYDAITASFQLRWTIPHAHSHVSDEMQRTTVVSRSHAAGSSGPVRTLQFSPNGYMLLLVDCVRCKLSIYHADSISMPVDLVEQESANLRVSCAAWLPQLAGTTETTTILSIGMIQKENENGTVRICKFQSDTTKITPINELNIPESDAQEDSDDTLGGWTCTSLYWLDEGKTLAAGFCRVTPSGNSSDDDDDDENDSAEHEAQMYILEMDPSNQYKLVDSISLGDIVPFFGVPKNGRHVFFSTQLPAKSTNNHNLSLILITANVGTEVELLGKGKDGSWKIFDLPEGSKITLPTNDDDDYFYPIGLSSMMIQSEDGLAAYPYVVLASTNSSLRLFRLINSTDSNFLRQEDVSFLSSHVPTVSVPQNSNRVDSLSSEPDLVEENVKGILSMKDDVATPSVLKQTAKQPFGLSQTIPTFGTGNLSFSIATSNPVPFGKNKPSSSGTPLFGATSFGFGTPVTSSSFPASTSSSFGTTFGINNPKPAFGLTSSLAGAQPVFGTTSTWGTTPSSKSPFPSNSGAVADTKSSPGFGFGETSVFGSSIATSNNTFGSLAESTVIDSSFGTFDTQKNLATNQTADTSVEKIEGEHKSNPDVSNPTAKTAMDAFDSLDKTLSSRLPVSMLEELLDAVGEGFHGDEFDRQLALIDPTQTGTISRDAFIQWYVDLVRSFDCREGSNDESIDSEERAEREEEKTKAKNCFLLLAKSDDKSTVSVTDIPKYYLSLTDLEQEKLYINDSDFQKLMESMKTTYCEEEHEKTIRRLAKNGNQIFLKDFLDWYISWLFDGEDSSEEGDPASPNADIAESQGGTTSGWGSIFAKKEGTWKCAVCRVDNDPGTKVCAACETAKPGQAISEVNSVHPTGVASSAIGMGGFTFSSAASTATPTREKSTNLGFSLNSTAATPQKGFSFGFGISDSGFKVPGVTASSSRVTPSASPKQETQSEKTVSDLKSDVAIRAFKYVDECKTGLLPMSKLGDLLDGIGEDFDEANLKRQGKILDPLGTGQISISSFVAWYTDFNSLSIPSSPILNKRRENATNCFKSLAMANDGEPYILIEDFQLLLKALETPLIDVDFSTTSQLLASEGGKIYLSRFLDWYVSWLLGAQRVSVSSIEVDEKKQSNYATNQSAMIASSVGSTFPTSSSVAGTKEDQVATKDKRVEKGGSLVLPFSMSNTDVVTTNEKCETPNQEAERIAKNAFEIVDTSKAGTLSISRIEDLLEALGEGFYGDELDAQLKLLDPLETGLIERDAFVSWYIQLFVSANTRTSFSNESIDSEERAERDEEMQKAKKAFLKIAEVSSSDRYIITSNFSKLIESLDTTYCEEEHRKTIKRLSNSEGKIFLDDFLAWYVDWLFGGDESSDDEEDEDDSRFVSPSTVSDLNPSKEQIATVSGWGSVFKKKEGSWKCQVCLVNNDVESKSCSACETPRPGLDKVSISTSATSGDTKLSGISFGFNPKKEAPNDTNTKLGASAIGPSGFSFASGLDSKAIAADDGKNDKSSHEEAVQKKNLGGFFFGQGQTKSSSSTMSASNPTPFTSIPVSAPNNENPPEKTLAKSSTSAYPPIPINAPTPFSSQAKASSTKATNSSNYPPLSQKAPTPFGGFQASTAYNAATNSSSSGYPPMAASAPTPFSSQAKGSSTKATNLSSYPPLSQKAPTPFGASQTSAAENAVTNFSSSGYPPMAASAPTPFSSQAKGSSTTTTNSSSYPPLSQKAPTPFGASQTSAAENAVTNSSSSGYPPMAASAPTPFSSQGKGSSTTTTNSSTYPPLSQKAPTPFGGFQASTADTAVTKSSTSIFPPVAANAPAPFSSQAKGSSTTATNSPSYPPLSQKAPTPFGGFQVSTADTAGMKSSTSIFPPVATNAPTLFSSQAKGSSMIETNSSSYPPLSQKAPTPFGAFQASTTETAVTNSSSSGYPPMAASAPTPFGSQAKGSSTTATNSSTFPPLSQQAPTPFGGFQATTADKAVTKSSTSIFPPVAANAPTLFSSQAKGSSTTATNSPSYPPLSQKAPTPFGGFQAPASNLASKAGIMEATNDSLATGQGLFKKSNVAATSAYPPLSYSSPSPFASHALDTPSSQKNLQVGSIKLPLPGPPIPSKVSLASQEHSSSPPRHKPMELSPCCKEFVKVVLLMDHSRSELAQRRPLPDDTISKEVDRIHDAVNHILVKLGSIVDSTNSCKLESAKILGRKAEASKKVGESDRMVRRLLSSESDDLAEVIANQPLDRESDELRRKLADLAFTVSRLLDLAKTKLSLSKSFVSQEVRHHLFTHLTDTFQRIKSLDEVSNRINRKLSEVSINSASRPIVNISASSRSLVSRHYGIVEDNSGIVSKWTDVESHLLQLKKPRRKLMELDIAKISQVARPKRPTPSQSTGTFETKSTNRKSQTLFSPSLPTAPRSGWNDVAQTDQFRSKQMTFSIPKDLKQTTLDTLGKNALESFGLSHQKISAASSINEGFSGQSNFPPPVSTTTTTPVRLSADQKPTIVQSPASVSTVPITRELQKESKVKSPGVVVPTLGMASSKLSLPKHDMPGTRAQSSSMDSLSALGNALSVPNSSDGNNESDMVEKSSQSANYFDVLTQFFLKHNPAKVSDTKKLLEKFKGREIELFAKISQKYRVDNPLKSDNSNSQKGVETTSTRSEPDSLSQPSEQVAPVSSPFGTSPAPFSMFSSTSNTFASATFQTAHQGSSSVSATTLPTTFGGTGMTSSSPFGVPPAMEGHNSSPFGAPSFGSSTPNPSAASSTSSVASFSGRSPRETLLSFYQQYNPLKVSEVDKLLDKYRGNEEQMFRNLAKKYSLDPSVFGLPPTAPGGGFGNVTTGIGGSMGAPPGGFGQISVLGGGPSFGSPVAAPTASFGASAVFGSNAATPPSGFGFGSLAQSFGSPNTGSSPFGAATPFGAARR